MEGPSVEFMAQCILGMAQESAALRKGSLKESEVQPDLVGCAGLLLLK